MQYAIRDLLVVHVGIIAILGLTAAVMAVISQRRLHHLRQEIKDCGPIRERLRALLPLQFGVFSLFVLTTMSALSFAVFRLPLLLPEKIATVAALWLCFACWQNRNYLHPLQGTISYAVRRKLAVSGFLGSLIWVPVFVGLYVWTALKSGRSICSADVLFCGIVLAIVSIATWKLVRAILPGQRWINTIDLG